MSYLSSEPWALPFAKTLRDARNLEAALRWIAKEINLTYISCALFSAIKRLDANLLTAKAIYPFRWQARYFLKHYVSIDPVLSYGKTAREPFDWDDLTTEDPVVRSFLEDAVRHGVGRNGYTVPVRSDPDADFSIVSFNSNVPKDEWAQFKDENAGRMAELAALIDLAARNDLKRHAQPAFLAKR